MFSNAESAGFDPTAATYSQGYEASVNICVIPIGITEISSATILVNRDDRVKKGDLLGYFSYGGY